MTIEQECGNARDNSRTAEARRAQRNAEEFKGMKKISRLPLRYLRVLCASAVRELALFAPLQAGIEERSSAGKAKDNSLTAEAQRARRNAEEFKGMKKISCLPLRYLRVLCASAVRELALFAPLQAGIEERSSAGNARDNSRTAEARRAQRNAEEFKQRISCLPLRYLRVLCASAVRELALSAPTQASIEERTRAAT